MRKGVRSMFSMSAYGKGEHPKGEVEESNRFQQPHAEGKEAIKKLG